MQVLQVQMTVGADPAEVGRARRWARARLLGSGISVDEPPAEALMLLISELVTNAVVHTGCPAVLRMVLPEPAPAPATAGRAAVPVDERVAGNGSGPSVRAVPGAAVAGGVVAEVGRWGADAGTVRVEVADVSALPPAPRHARGDETGGRGLELVEGLADRWGWAREEGGKRIWCEVDRVAGVPCRGGRAFETPQECAAADRG